jgi:dienelactone hydrolase
VRRAWPWVVAVLAALVAAGAVVLAPHLRAAALLARFSGAPPASLLAAFGRHDVDVRAWSFAEGGSRVPARLYVPRGVSHPPALVLVHGVHHLGIDEPRLQRFARAFASTGISVLTPELAGLAAYHIEPASTATIGAAVRALSASVQGPVGLMGLSFAGGLALLAAAAPEVAPDVAYVVAIGAHDDLLRVLRFYAVGEAPAPDGSSVRLRPHDYGPAVLVYTHAEDFFAPAELDAAREALAAWLREEEGPARAAAARLHGEARALVDGLLDRRVEAIAPVLLRELARPEAVPLTSAVSPHGRLGGLRAPTFLLHGAGDVVVPATETLWLAREVPPAALRAVLVSPAVVHVELGEVSRLDELRLVHFLAGVLAEAGRGRLP